MADALTVPKQTWMAVLVGAAIAFSFALACGMPFAALGALAVLVFPIRHARWLAGLGWLANQVIGFGLLGYPLDVLTLAWGLALGLSAVAAVGAAAFAIRFSGTVRIGAALFAAWVAQQGTVFAASLVLGGTATAFAPDVVWFIFWTNALGFAALLAVQVLGARIGVARAPFAQAAG